MSIWCLRVTDTALELSHFDGQDFKFEEFLAWNLSARGRPNSASEHHLRLLPRLSRQFQRHFAKSTVARRMQPDRDGTVVGHPLRLPAASQESRIYPDRHRHTGALH